MIILGLVHIDALVLVRLERPVVLLEGEKRFARSVNTPSVYGETVKDGAPDFCAWGPAAGI
jgi:hypothetical protein